MQQRFQIRVFQPGDEIVLAELQRRSLMAIDQVFYSSDELESLCAGITPKRVLDLAETETLRLATTQDGTVLGFGGARSDGTQGAIARLFTEPKAQSTGVGSALLAATEADLSAKGVRHATVEASLSAVAFYETRGYQRLEHRTRPTAGGIDLRFLFMEKDL